MNVLVEQIDLTHDRCKDNVDKIVLNSSSYNLVLVKSRVNVEYDL